MNVKAIDINEVRPYHRNPRSHEKSLESIMESIVKFGYRVPILIDKDNEIVLGHGRYMAVRNLKGTLGEHIKELEEQGRKELADNLREVDAGKIQAIMGDSLTDKEIKEFRLTDNKVQELTTWMKDLLVFEARELSEGIIGFEDEELQRLLRLSSNLGFENYEPGEVEDYEEGMQNRFADLIESKSSDIVDLSCPHCLQTFSVIKRELQRIIDFEG